MMSDVSTEDREATRDYLIECREAFARFEQKWVGELVRAEPMVEPRSVHVFPVIGKVVRCSLMRGEHFAGGFGKVLHDYVVWGSESLDKAYGVCVTFADQLNTVEGRGITVLESAKILGGVLDDLGGVLDESAFHVGVRGLDWGVSFYKASELSPVTPDEVQILLLRAMNGLLCERP
jgi:hypothetical protein